MTTPPIPKPPAGTSKWQVTTGKKKTPQRIGLYGTGGIGKSSLAALAPNPIFIDLENGSHALDVTRISGISRYEDVRALLQDATLRQYGTAIIDTGTKLQELAVDFVLRSKSIDKSGNKAQSIEDYGFGKGVTYAYEAMNLVLSDLDKLAEAGVHVVVVCHDIVNKAPNPSGEDFIRYEPNLMGGSGKQNSVRERFKGWCDSLLYIGYDVAEHAKHDNKAVGSGTRTIYTSERPTHWAKCRFGVGNQPYKLGDGSIWTKVLGDSQ